MRQEPLSSTTGSESSDCAEVALVASRSDGEVAERMIPLEGLHNRRGYQTRPLAVDRTGSVSLRGLWAGVEGEVGGVGPRRTHTHRLTLQDASVQLGEEPDLVVQRGDQAHWLDTDNEQPGAGCRAAVQVVKQLAQAAVPAAGRSVPDRIGDPE